MATGTIDGPPDIDPSEIKSISNNENYRGTRKSQPPTISTPPKN
jgi:hypothetical protein